MIEKSILNSDGTVEIVPHGTGFLFTDSLLGSFLVTNKHILDHRDSIFIRLNKNHFNSKKDTLRYYRQPYSLIGQDSKTIWKGHPNLDIDIAALRLRSTNLEVDIRFLEYSRFREFEDLHVGEDIYFFGFPLGLTGPTGKEDFPLLRSGIVAYKSIDTTRIAGIIIDSTMFLIDGFSFGGNSGSPVLTRVTREKAALVGIVKGHVPLNRQFVIGKTLFFVQPSGDTLFLNAIPDTIHFEQNTGLAIAICADRIRETLEQFRKEDSLKSK